MKENIIHKYGTFKNSQIEDYKVKMQKKIFWLIIYTDENTRNEYKNVDVKNYQTNIMRQLSGLNSLLSYPTDIVEILSVLESAMLLLDDDTFDFKMYRKLILDAGAMVKRMKVGE